EAAAGIAGAQAAARPRAGRPPPHRSRPRAPACRRRLDGRRARQPHRRPRAGRSATRRFHSPRAPPRFGHPWPPQPASRAPATQPHAVRPRKPRDVRSRRPPPGARASRRRRAGPRSRVGPRSRSGKPTRVSQSAFVAGTSLTSMGGGGVTLFRIRGIRIAVDYSWFVVLFLIIFWLSGFYRAALNEPDNSSTAYVLAVASAALFFLSILLHELGHAFVARRHNIGVSGITLWMFGGFARLEKDSDTPGTEFKIAIAGPVVTAAIVVVCAIAGLALAGGNEFKHPVLTQA